MARAFAALWAEPGGSAAKARLLAAAFGRLPAVIAIEWLEYLGATRAPGQTRKGRGGMGFWRNLRFALRTLGKAPSFTITSVLLVALGVGAVTTIFTLVDHVLLRPLPYADADRLVYVDEGSHSGPIFREMERMRAADLWAASSTDDVNVVGEGEPLRLRQARVNPGFVELFGMRAQRGRLFAEEDFVRADGVVLSAGAWERIWGSDPAVVGRTIEINGAPVEVVGVLDASFSTPESMLRGQVVFWRPLDWSN
jgi:hypothetical protein